jgi:hypothetical protein
MDSLVPIENCAKRRKLGQEKTPKDYEGFGEEQQDLVRDLGRRRKLR